MPSRTFLVAATLSVVLSACERRADIEGAATAAPAAAASPAQTTAQRVRAVGQLGPGRGTLVISLAPPKSGKLTEGAPLSVEARGAHLSFPAAIRENLDSKRLPLRLPIDVTDGAMGPAEVDLSYYWCGHEEGAACRPERVKLVVELDTTGDAPGGEAHLTHVAAGT